MIITEFNSDMLKWLVSGNVFMDLEFNSRKVYDTYVRNGFNKEEYEKENEATVTVSDNW